MRSLFDDVDPASKSAFSVAEKPSSHRHSPYFSHKSRPSQDDPTMAVASRPRSSLGFLSRGTFGRSDKPAAAGPSRDDDIAGLGLVPRDYHQGLDLLAPHHGRAPSSELLQARHSREQLQPYDRQGLPTYSSLSLSPQIPQSPAYTHSPSPPRLAASRASEWVTGDSSTSQGALVVSDPAKAAYDRARETLARELSPSEAEWLGKWHTVDDVQGAMDAALGTYLAKGRESKAVHWLRSCSQRILHYGSIFDALVQHHPEYVSLAWGAFKFLFIAVVQHEELCTEISKAIARIAHELPRLSLRTDIYRTEHMQNALAAVYAKIVEFAVLAIRWYKKGRFLQSLAAIAKPWDLGYKGIVEEIIELSRRVDEVANASSQAEIRMLTGKNDLLQSKVDLLEGKIDRLTEVLIAQQSLNSQILIDLREYKHAYHSNQIDSIREAFLLPSDPSPDTSLTYIRSLRNRRRQKTPTSLPASQLQKLRSFLLSPESRILLAQGQGIRTSALDFAADFLDVVTERGIKVLWALPDKAPAVLSPSQRDDDDVDDDAEDTDTTGKVTVIGILRSLVLQAMNLEPGITGDGRYPITMRHLRAAKSVEEWFCLLERCVRSFRRLLMVIDLGLIEAAVANSSPSSFSTSIFSSDESFTVDDFVHSLEGLVEKLPRGEPLVKIVIVSWRFGAIQRLTQDGETFEDDRSRVYTDRGPRMERLARRPKYRAVAKRRGERMPERFREIVGGFGGCDEP